MPRVSTSALRRAAGWTACLGAFHVATAASPATAQQTGEVTGRVTYAGNGRGVAGALVFLPEASLGVTTDAEGRYRVAGVPPGRHAVLTTLLGCTLDSRAADVQSGRRLGLDIVLSPPVLDIEGLVVTARGEGGATATYSVARLDAQDGTLDPGTARSVGSMLQGRAPGVRVLQGSGQPGSEPSIQLRGPTSIRGSQDPLVVVDGVITQGRISEIDPLDVLRVDVLRGAAAAASYGARGQAGVIEITTRRGPGGRANVRGPLVLVDGVATDGTLADVDATRIEHVRRLDGTAGALLYGARAEAGVIEVTTSGGPAPGARTLEPVCIDPTR